MYLKDFILLMIIVGCTYAASVTTTPTETNTTTIDTSTENANCVLIELGQLQFNWTYTTIDNKTASELFTITDIPTDQKSVCGESNQSLTVTYGNHTNIKFRFEAEASEYTLTGIDLFSNVTDAEASNNIVELSYHSTDKIVTPIGKSNSCIKETSLPFNSIEVKSINVSITNLQFEAFRTKNNKEFSPSQDCMEKVEPKVDTKVVPKDEPKVEPKAEPKVEPKVEPKAEPQVKGSAVAIYIVVSLIAVIAIALIGFFVWCKCIQVRGD